MNIKDTKNEFFLCKSNNVTITAYFKNGSLFQVLPSPTCNQYEARFLVSDGIKFDLEMAADISDIPVPKFELLHGLPNISHSLDYVLKRKAGDLHNKGLFDLSITCLRKANQLMSRSPIHWNKKDYFYIVLELARANKFEEAKREKTFIEKNYFEKYDFSCMHRTVLRKELDTCRQFGTDLVESDDAPNCNELCAKYRKRIYSLTGKDKRFPVMTEEIYNSGLMFFPFLDGVSQPKYCTHHNMVEYNSRPFVDDRTDEEKDNYIRYTKQRIFEDRYVTDFLEYKQICAYIPSFKPRSIKAYQEMKYDNSEDFQELAQLAEEAHIDIEI